LNYDPRAHHQTHCGRSFPGDGAQPEIALDLEKIARPRQIYKGYGKREFVPLGKRRVKTAA
jgi:citrate synthase